MGLPLRGWLVTGIVWLSSAGALAGDTKTPFPSCTTAPTEADRKAAQGAFAAGQGSFNEADYATAITYWRDAYRRDCTAHALLLNLARAYELKSDRSEAVNALETYLQRKPDDPGADQIRRRIENLKAQIAASAPPPTPTTPSPATTTTSTMPPPPPPDSGDKGRGRSAVPLVVAGAGGVLAVVGTIVLVGGISKESEAEDACPQRVGCDNAIAEKGNEGRSQQRTGGIVLGVGAAAAIGGVIWYFVQPPSGGGRMSHQNTPQRAGVTPVIGPGFAGLSLAGRF
jgi:hypothetical protein